jgi:hypothetical protein
MSVWRDERETDIKSEKAEAVGGNGGGEEENTG